MGQIRCVCVCVCVDICIKRQKRKEKEIVCEKRRYEIAFNRTHGVQRITVCMLENT